MKFLYFMGILGVLIGCGIQTEIKVENLPQALDLAQSSGKLVLVDIYSDN